MNNPQELKQAILKTLAEKGDYTTILQHLTSEEKENKANESQEKLTKLITPISAFADLLTENTKGAFLEDVTAKVDANTKQALKDLSEAITEAREALQSELRELMSATKTEAISDHLTRYQDAEKTLREQMLQFAYEVTAAKADELLPGLVEQAKLTEEEVEQIIMDAALQVESQVSAIIGDYIKETGITAEQITDFDEKVRALIPQYDFSKLTFNASQITDLPNFSGAASRNWVDKKLASINLNDLSDVTVSATDPATADGTFWVDIS